MPRVEAGPVVLWRLGDALLAIELMAVEEIAPVDAAGRARSREAELEVAVPPGLAPDQPAAAAVVVRMAGAPEPRRMALAAHAVDGVVEGEQVGGVATPAWLEGLEHAHIRALLRLDDGRVAALLDTDALFRGP